MGDKIEALEAIGFTWQMKKHSNPVPWMARYEELKQYRLKMGHCEVPRGNIDNPSLGMWVATLTYQYKLRKEGKHASLSADKIEALEAIGFTWQIKKPNSSVPYEVLSVSSPSTSTRTK